jgi:hypothetical protein
MLIIALETYIRYRDIICTYLLLLDLIGATFTLLLLPLAERNQQ